MFDIPVRVSDRQINAMKSVKFRIFLSAKIGNGLIYLANVHCS